MSSQSRSPEWLIPLIVAIAFLMEQLDITIVSTAIPDMAISLHVSVIHLNLAISAYVLALAVFIPVSGWIADRFGACRTFVSALAVFTLGSALCGIADSMALLITARVVQGVGGALMTPVGRLILLNSFPRAQMLKAMTYTSLPAVVGPIIGPLFGGYLTTYASWRWVFYVNLPFGLLGMVLAARFIRMPPRSDLPPFDFFGFFILGTGVALAQGGLEMFSHHATHLSLLLLLLSAGILLKYWLRSRNHPHPVADLRLFRERSFTIATLGGGLSRIAMNGPMYLLPLLLQTGLGMSPLKSGSLTFLSIWGSVVVRIALSRLLKMTGFRELLIGGAIACSLILAGFSYIGHRTPDWWIAASILLFGLARALQFMTSNTLAYADIEERWLSRATSLGGLLQQLTVSFGVAISAALLGLLSRIDLHPGLDDFHVAFRILAVLPLLSLPMLWRLQDQDGARVRNLPARN